MALSIACPGISAAQTFTGAGAAIPDDGNTLEIPLEVSGLGAVLDTSNFGLEQVCLTIEHTWLSDLDIRIVAPDGTTRLLVAGEGSDTDNYTNTCFNADAAGPIGNGTPPYEGSFRPQAQMGAVNNGQNGNGTWHLRIQDTYAFADEGAVILWSITFGNAPAGYFAFTAGDLPLLVIDTDGATLVDGAKIPATMGIVDNGPGDLNRATDPFNGYDGSIGIDIRGNSSQSLSPKKSYGLELRDGSGTDLDAPLLGMPAESDWILSANYFDKSFLNNALTYQLARDMGRYAPRYRHVEVIVNGEYQGLYVLLERIKRGPDRVDIAKLRPEDIAGDDITGGYILSVDRAEEGNGFVSQFPPAGQEALEVFLEYRYPKTEDIVPQQAAYISSYINAFESALDGPDFADAAIGHRAFIEVPSFIDLFLINEFSKNVDGYRLSCYLFKDKDSNGGKLHAGPAWDYDIAWGNADYCEGSRTDGWAYEFGDVCGGDGQQVPFWWSRLLEDPAYAHAVGCRWNELREGLFSPTRIAVYCDSMATVLNAAQQRNFTVWPILGTYVWPNPSPIPTSYAGEIIELKDWVQGRWSWLDENLSDIATCNTAIHGAHQRSHRSAPYPDPYMDHVMIDIADAGAVQVDLLDALGRIVHHTAAMQANGMVRIALPEVLQHGSYILRVGAGGAITSHRIQH